MIQRLRVQTPAEVGDFFLILKNYLCKLPFGNKFELGNNFITCLFLHPHATQFLLPANSLKQETQKQQKHPLFFYDLCGIYYNDKIIKEHRGQ